MIKVIEGYKLKEGADIQPILLKLRSNAMQYPGFMGAENLMSERDVSIVSMVSTWEKIDDWTAWESSTLRQELLQQAQELLVEDPKITMYRIMPTVTWVG